MKKDLLKLLDLSKEDIVTILNTADQLKYETKHNIHKDYLKGKTLAMIFEKNSTRTRVSFEAGMFQLGGHALFLSGKESQIGRGEPIQDTARVLSRYCDGIMIRTFGQDEVEQLAKYADIPVINGLTDFCHPCQVLADLLTVREHKAVLEGLKLCYIGDGNNMANSLIVGGLKMGMEVSAACPEGYDPDPTGAGLRPEQSRPPVYPRPHPPGGRCPRRCGGHRCVGLHGSGGGAGRAGKNLRGLLHQWRADEAHPPGLHGPALPPRPQGGGDQRRGL